MSHKLFTFEVIINSDVMDGAEFQEEIADASSDEAKRIMLDTMKAMLIEWFHVDAADVEEMVYLKKFEEEL